MQISRMIKTLVVVFTLVALTGSGVAAQQGTGSNLICEDFADSPTQQRVAYYMGEGAGYLAAREFSSAVRSYSCIIEQLDEGFVGAYNQRAVAYTMQQAYEAAIADYDTVLTLDRSSRAALNNRGIAYAALQNYERALEDFDAALGIDADYVPALMNRGVISAIAGDFESAITDLEAAISASGVDGIVAQLRDPDRDPNVPIPAYDRDEAQMYAILGIIYSGFALENYNDYLLLSGGSADQRIQSAAGSLESRFNFDLRLDDGTWLLSADFAATGEEE